MQQLTVLLLIVVQYLDDDNYDDRVKGCSEIGH